MGGAFAASPLGHLPGVMGRIACRGPMLSVFPQHRLEQSEWESARTPIMGACGSQEQALLIDLPGHSCRRVRGGHVAGPVPWEWASGVEAGDGVGVQPLRRLSPRMPLYLEDGIRIAGEGEEL